MIPAFHNSLKTHSRKMDANANRERMMPSKRWTRMEGEE